MKKKLLAVLIALISVITLAFALPACNVSSDGRGSANNGANPGGNNNDETQEFSSILDKILTDKYYTDLDYYVRAHSNAITPELKPIPYNFLRNHGHNVDAYLDGTLDAFASSYIYDNDKNHIYVSVKAENVSNSQYGNYYTNYVLKYPLTNQEYEEYTYLCKGEYLQGLFYIQELDNQKTPEILLNNKVSVSTYNDMIVEYSKWKDTNIINKSKLDIDLQQFNDDEIIISVRGSTNSNYYTTQIGQLKITPTIYTGIKYYDNNIYYMAAAENVLLNHQDEYQSSLQNITSFSYGTNIKYANPYPNYKK